MTPPPPDTLSGNHPELAVHLRMNLCSEQRASYYVRASIAFLLSCKYNCMLCLLCIYCFFPPLLLSGSPMTDADAPVFDYFVDDRTPLPSSFQASRATSPLPHIAYFSIFICCTRHMLLLRYFPIQMHSLSLSPLVVPFLYPIAAYIIYI